MKKLLLGAVLLCFAVLSGTAAQVDSNTLAKQDFLFMPEKVYAVPGVECNIYFKNIFLAVNQNNFVFDVECKYGRNDLRRWRFLPTVKDGGKSFPLTLKVYDEDGLVAERSTTVYVANADAGKDRVINILQIGDSLTNYTIHSAQLYKYCQQPGNPKLTMIGTRHFNPRGEKIPAEVMHEGYAGWRWESFLTRFEGKGRGKKKFVKSKFLYKKDGKVVVSLADYLKTYKFPTPDVITIQLGGNDIFAATDADRDERIKKILDNADTFIAALRKDAPNAIIGVGFLPPNANQDAFGEKYKCRQTAWGKNKNQFYTNCAMQKHFAAKHPDIIMIPTVFGVDSEYNFPVRKEPANQRSKTIVARQNNGVHPNHDGYRQVGDVYYAWLKNVLDKKVK